MNLFGFFLTKIYEEGISTYSVHPGVIRTNLQNADPSFMGSMIRFLVSTNAPGVISIPDGARTTLFCAVSLDAPKSSGMFHSSFGKVDHLADKWINNKPYVDQLWDFANAQIH
jgi:hypothetical protein